MCVRAQRVTRSWDCDQGPGARLLASLSRSLLTGMAASGGHWTHRCTPAPARYVPEMGDRRVTCGGGCTCEGNEERAAPGLASKPTSITGQLGRSPLGGSEHARRARQRIRTTWNPGHGRGRARVPVHRERDLSARSTGGGSTRAAAAVARVKVSMMMMSREGRMDWVDPWKVGSASKETRKA